MANGGSAMAAFWNAGEDEAPLTVKARLYRFQQPTTLKLLNRAVTAKLQPGQAVVIKLPAGDKRVRMVLPPGTAGLLLKDGKELSLHWAGGTAKNIRCESTAESLLLLPVGGEPRQFAVAIVSGKSVAGNRISTSALYQGSFSSRGQEFLQVQAAAGNMPGILRIRGKATGVFIDSGGHIRSGNDIPVEQSGSLQLQHASGRVLVWLDSQAGPSMPASTKREFVSLEKPATLELHGASQNLGIESKVVRLVHLQSETALVTRLLLAGQPERVEAYPDGIDKDVFIPVGESRLTLTALGGVNLHGLLDVTSVEATEFSEGFGPAVILPGGGSKLYKFTLEQDGPIGIGVSASSDVVDAELLDAEGKILGHGVVLMPELPKGNYWLLLRSPVNADPVHAMPVLVGSKPPGSGPPTEVIHKYLQRAGRKLSTNRGEP